MGSHEDTVNTLEVELGQVERGFRSLTADQWATPTKRRPGRGPEHPDPRLPLIG
jgi:hypothetical protein